MEKYLPASIKVKNFPRLFFVLLTITFSYFGIHIYQNNKYNKSGMFLVADVIDGDTIKISTGEKVRFIGIDTPESTIKTECFGKEASDFSKNLLEGKKVDLEKDISDRDKYGRLLRYVYLDGMFVNEYLVRQGYATVFTYPPDVKYKDVFINAQKEARRKKAGLWGKCQKGK